MELLDAVENVTSFHHLSEKCSFQKRILSKLYKKSFGNFSEAEIFQKKISVAQRYNQSSQTFWVGIITSSELLARKANQIYKVWCAMKLSLTYWCFRKFDFTFLGCTYTLQLLLALLTCLPKQSVYNKKFWRFLTPFYYYSGIKKDLTSKPVLPTY